MNDALALHALLANHYGSETIFRHSIVRGFVYTEGVKTFAENAGGGAYWLLDILATEPGIAQGVRDEGFVIALLKVRGGRATLEVGRDMDGGSVVDLVFSRAIDFTDCPDGAWRFYLTFYAPRTTCMLPSEY